MLRAEVFTANPGKMTVTWFDFSLMCFDVVTRYELVMKTIQQIPEKKQNGYIQTEVRMLLEHFKDSYEILNNDKDRYDIYLTSAEETYFNLLTINQIINSCAQKLKIDLNINYADDDVEGCFNAWFQKHGKDFEKGG